MTPPVEVKAYSARMRRFVTVLWIVSLVLVILERFSAATIGVVQHGFASSDLRGLGCEAIAALPELAYVLALWWVREALARFSRGELFAPSIATMLDRVGIALAAGAAARILIVPGACRLLGHDPGYWIAFDAASLVLCATGFALTAISRALRHASAIESELSEIF
jgi:hypothetical protein